MDSDFATKLKESEKVDFFTTLRSGALLILSSDRSLVDALVKRGGTARWYDRTEWETRFGGKPRMQAEVVMMP